MSYLDSSGVVIETVEEILQELATEQQTQIDPLVGTDPPSLLGQLNGIFASHEREAQETVQALASSLNRANAEGAVLDAVCAITGTSRNPATPSRFKGTRRLSWNLEPGATVTSGITKASVAGRPDLVFVATETVTNSGGVAADFLVAHECETLGPIPVVAGTCTVIATPGAGLNTVTNPLDAVIGSDVEGDTELRIRAEREVRRQGGSTASAIAADILAIENEEGERPVISVTVLENTSDVASAFGLPAHSFEVIIWDGIGANAEDLDVAAVIAANRPAGIVSYGTTSAGGEKFTRPTQRTVEITNIVVYYGPGLASADEVKATIANLLNSIQRPCSDPGVDGIVPWSTYVSAVAQMTGVSRVGSLAWRFAAGPTVTNTDLAPGIREIAVTSTGSISVTLIPDPAL